MHPIRWMGTFSSGMLREDRFSRLRVLDFFTFFSYIGPDGTQTISSVHFVADNNSLFRKASDFLLTIPSKSQ